MNSQNIKWLFVSRVLINISPDQIFLKKRCYHQTGIDLINSHNVNKCAYNVCGFATNMIYHPEVQIYHICKST